MTDTVPQTGIAAPPQEPTAQEFVDKIWQHAHAALAAIDGIKAIVLAASTHPDNTRAYAIEAAVDGPNGTYKQIEAALEKSGKTDRLHNALVALRKRTLDALKDDDLDSVIRDGHEITTDTKLRASFNRDNLFAVIDALIDTDALRETVLIDIQTFMDSMDRNDEDVINFCSGIIQAYLPDIAKIDINSATFQSWIESKRVPMEDRIVTKDGGIVEAVPLKDQFQISDKLKDVVNVFETTTAVVKKAKTK